MLVTASRLLTCCFVCLYAARSFAAPEAKDAGLVAFRSLVALEKMESVLAQTGVDQALGDFAAGSRPSPAGGVFVNAFPPESRLAEAGVTPGSVLQKWGKGSYFGSEGKAGDMGEFIWVTPDNESRISHAEGGNGKGYFWTLFRNVPNWYLRQGQRNPQWDRWVFGALRQQDQDPVLAESMWARAVEKGYKTDRLSSWVGMMLALANQDFPRAEAFAAAYGPVKAVKEAQDFPLLPEDWQQLAFLTGNPQHFVECANAGFSQKRPATAEANARLQVELSKSTPAGTSSPVELAKKMSRRSFLSNANVSAKGWLDDANWMHPLHRKATDAAYEGRSEFPPETELSPLDHYMTQFLSPADPARDVDVEIRFEGRAEPLGPNQACEFDRVFIFGLVDPDHTEVEAMVAPGDARLLVANMSFGSFNGSGGPEWSIMYPSTDYNSKEVAWQGSDFPKTSLMVRSRPPFSSDPNAVHTLRIVRVKGQAEAVLDGRRLALVNVPAQYENSSLLMRVIGARIVVTALRADVLE